MSLLSRMFGRKGPQKPIDEMSLQDIGAFVKARPNEMAASVLIAIVRRLTDIAYFDHETTDQERATALELLPSIDADLEAGLGADSDKFAAYCEAAAHHRGTARHYGFGSLQWKMDEEGVEGAQVIPFIARADHAELLPALLEMFEPEDIKDIRPALLTELATARALDQEQPLDVLSRLAASDDGALTQLVDGRQLGALRRAQAEPGAAEEVLRHLGVTP